MGGVPYDYMGNEMTYFPELMSQTDTVWSKDPVISCVPVELKEREIISAE